jgi:putative DNA primase/helicase
MQAAEIARTLGGKRYGDGFLARCPAHEDRTPSLSIRDGKRAVLLTCFAGCNRRDVLAELRRLGLLEKANCQNEYLFPDLPPTGHDTSPNPTMIAPTDRINATLRRAMPILGTPAETYLLGRGLNPKLANPDALRFLPATNRYPPTLVSVVTAFTDASRVLSLQFTPIQADGGRGQRTFLRGTRVAAGVVRLVDDAAVIDRLGVGEGIETCLAVMTAMHRAERVVLPVWSALSVHNLASLPVLPGIEAITVYGDADVGGLGQKAAYTIARRWAEAGREARVALPPVNDWNTSP